jgi:hypothetical protein
MQILGLYKHILRMTLNKFGVLPTRRYCMGTRRRLSDMLVVRATFSSAKRADLGK